MAIDEDSALGFDIKCVNDVDPNLTLVDSRQCLAESAARRITTVQNGLFYDPHYGVDIVSNLSGIVRPTLVASQIEGEVLKDERVSNVAADVTYDNQTETLKVVLQIEDITGETFKSTVTVTNLTTELLVEGTVL